MAKRCNVIIMGAAGRDFHNFNVLYRDNPAVEVIAFTATQIPGVGGRRYPSVLAGTRYPDGIPIVDESELEAIGVREDVDLVVFAYSDVTHADVMHAASRALAIGADFALLGPKRTMLRSNKPVITVTAIRTGCGKSQTTRWLAQYLRERGFRVAVLRHPMPYGDLARQAVQRFASRRDLDTQACTNEEREEYEPYIAAGGVIFAGVDYQAILRQAEEESDIVLWDGGNNDFAFVCPDLNIVIADALRPGQTTAYHPGEAVLRMADVVVVNKVDAAAPADVSRIVREIETVNPGATIVHAASPTSVDDPGAISGACVLVVEDGPTITHGGLPHGAGYAAARALGARRIVDPRASAAPAIAALYEQFPHIGPVLPAVGYDGGQREALRRTIEDSAADLILIATPFDLAAHLQLSKPSLRVTYEYADAGCPTLGSQVDAFLIKHGLTQ